MGTTWQREPLGADPDWPYSSEPVRRTVEQAEWVRTVGCVLLLLLSLLAALVLAVHTDDVRCAHLRQAGDPRAHSTQCQQDRP